MRKQDKPINMLPTAMHPKHNKLPAADFSFRNHFANLGSLSKVSIPVQSSIPF